MSKGGYLQWNAYVARIKREKLQMIVTGLCQMEQGLYKYPKCINCGLYLGDTINQKVEDRLYTSGISEYSGLSTYEELPKAPTINLFKLK